MDNLFVSIREATDKDLSTIRDVEAAQRRAETKQKRQVGHLRRVKIAHVDRGQAGAIIEHWFHVRYLWRIESADINGFQIGAAVEHGIHRGYIACIETAHVDAAQWAVIEHHHHVRHRRGVEIGDARDGCQVGQIPEPAWTGRRTSILKWTVEHDGLDGCILCPTRSSSRIVHIILRARAGWFVAIIVEC